MAQKEAEKNKKNVRNIIFYIVLAIVAIFFIYLAAKQAGLLGQDMDNLEKNGIQDNIFNN